VTSFSLSVHSSIREIGEREWDALLGADPEPHLRWTFLESFEATGCVDPEIGWAPALISIRRDGELVAAAPAYIKGNSDGEFVFDHAWAEFAYQRLNVAYYPKLIVASPFTPATGPRLLVAEGVDLGAVTDAFVRGLESYVNGLGLSSAHVLFPRKLELERLEAAGMLGRLGVQYHWQNRGYATFDDFLSCYTSKRRSQVRRERAELAKQNLEIAVYNGAPLPAEVIDYAYEFYCATVAKYYWGRRYLNRQWFEEICGRMPEQVLVVLARDSRTKRAVGGAFNLLGGRRLFGRYWGQREEVRFLHFNVCYYQGIDECIARGLDVFEPGAGGEHKVARGFEPTATFSAHYLANPRMKRAIADYLVRERAALTMRLAEEAPILRPFAPSEK
jgi:uncharacterized protein